MGPLGYQTVRFGRMYPKDAKSSITLHFQEHQFVFVQEHQFVFGQLRNFRRDQLAQQDFVVVGCQYCFSSSGKESNSHSEIMYSMPFRHASGPFPWNKTHCAKSYEIDIESIQRRGFLECSCSRLQGMGNQALATSSNAFRGGTLTATKRHS